jgi:hypothetical protein
LALSSLLTEETLLLLLLLYCFACAGFEMQVLEGAEALLSSYNVWYIMAECNVDIVGPEGRKKYLK